MAATTRKETQQLLSGAESVQLKRAHTQQQVTLMTRKWHKTPRKLHKTTTNFQKLMQPLALRLWR